jgi:intraflagellar transport protein 56
VQSNSNNRYIHASQFQRSVNQQGVNHGSLIAYCSFHLGDFKRALEEYQSLLQNPKKTMEEPTIWLNIACCYFTMGMYSEAHTAATKGSECSLKTRLLFHLSQKLGDEDGVIKYHSKLEETLENQLSLASMHYLRIDYQSSIDIYKRILLDNRLKIWVAFAFMF